MISSNICKSSYFTQERITTQENSNLSYMKQTIGERIRARRKELKLRQEDVAKAIDVNRVAISQWERDETQPNGANLFRLEKALQTYASWIIDGIEPTIKEDKLDYPTDIQFDIFIIQAYQASEKSLNTPNSYITSKSGLICPNETIKSTGSKPHNLRVLIMNNDSMAPTINKNTVLFVDISEFEMQSGYVYLINWYGEERIKRAFKDGKNSFKLKSDNQNNALYTDDWVDFSNNDDVKVLGRIVYQSGNL